MPAPLCTGHIKLGRVLHKEPDCSLVSMASPHTIAAEYNIPVFTLRPASLSITAAYRTQKLPRPIKEPAIWVNASQRHHDCPCINSRQLDNKVKNTIIK